MASVKRLKKDIDYLTFSVIADCFNYSFVSGKSNDEVSGIVKEVIAVRNGLLDRVRGAKKLEDKKEIKNYFKAIYNDLMSNVDAAFTKLSEIVKAN
ncbi:MAG: hypothetical protein OSJ36_01775 [Odoribacter sp.]|nr:hypothetical protein [Odoribacter sp.]